MLRKIRKLISWLKYNPRLFMMHLDIQIKKLLPLPKGPVRKKINGLLFELDFNYDAAIKSMYIGGYEMDMVFLMKKILKEGDTFIDVGANIGYISAIAAGLVGKNGQVHSFEPVPQHYGKLKNMARMNPGYKIVANPFALGEQEENADIIEVVKNNIGWNTMVPAIVKNKKSGEIFKVPVRRLDGYIKESLPDKISLIKIDVEGFEFPVLKGLSGYFSRTTHHPVIICEVNPFICESMGYKLVDLSEYMRKFGYNSYNLINCKVRTDITKLKETADIVFIHN